MIRRYEIFADYHQFYLWDRARDASSALDYTEADCTARIKTGPFIVVIMPERNMAVPVTLELADRAPDPDFEAWDHVTEASLDLPSGGLEIHECTGGSVDVLEVEPGSYRVRTHHGGLDSLSEDGLDGDDQYRIVLWPAPASEVVVIKQFTGGIHSA